MNQELKYVWDAEALLFREHQDICSLPYTGEEWAFLSGYISGELLTLGNSTPELPRYHIWRTDPLHLEQYPQIPPGQERISKLWNCYAQGTGGLLLWLPRYTVLIRRISSSRVSSTSSGRMVSRQIQRGSSSNVAEPISTSSMPRLLEPPTENSISNTDSPIHISRRHPTHGCDRSHRSDSRGQVNHHWLQNRGEDSIHWSEAADMKPLKSGNINSNSPSMQCFSRSRHSGKHTSSMSIDSSLSRGEWLETWELLRSNGLVHEWEIERTKSLIRAVMGEESYTDFPDISAYPRNNQGDSTILREFFELTSVVIFILYTIFILTLWPILIILFLTLNLYKHDSL